MQGLADGYFIIPYTIGDYLASTKFKSVKVDQQEYKDSAADATSRINRLIEIQGKTTVNEFHKQLGKVMWEYVGMGRNKKRLQKALKLIPQIRDEFWKDVKVTGNGNDVNNEVEKAGRVADFLELGELLAFDALHREESCGGHFREEHQTPEGEAKRNDAKFSYVAAWEYQGEDRKEKLHKEPLTFEYVKPSERSYK
jgi:succinate dehydrogenase / fumarate reductase flavoprotein subunit